MAKPVDLNDDSLPSYLSSGTLVLDFWAGWCAPCKALNTVMEDLANVFEGKATIGKIDVDTNPMSALKYNIRQVPTILVLKDGVVVEQIVGSGTGTTIRERIQAHL